MNMTPERMQAMSDNFAFYNDFRNALTRAVAPFPSVRTLDYGADAIPLSFSLFSDLHPIEEVVAFDPGLDLSEPTSALPNSVVRWTNQEPDGEFDLVICHFSIHHMDMTPDQVVEKLTRYNPRVLAIAEYDFSSATQERFQYSFIADAEKNELAQLFNGDINACFQLHSKYGANIYLDALIRQRFRLPDSGYGQGKGAASHKFFVLGTR